MKESDMNEPEQNDTLRVIIDLGFIVAVLSWGFLLLSGIASRWTHDPYLLQIGIPILCCAFGLTVSILFVGIRWILRKFQR